MTQTVAKLEPQPLSSALKTDNATQFPCRHIPLTPRGETVNSFYEWGTEDELENALREWLLETIKELESGKKAAVRAA